MSAGTHWASYTLLSCFDLQLQDVHKWSFGRPDPKSSKGNDDASAEDIPLEGLDNGLAIQDSKGSQDRCVSSCVCINSWRQQALVG